MGPTLTVRARRGPGRPATAAAGAAALAAVVVAGTFTAPPAVSAPFGDCPTAAPIAELTASEPVTGKTVVSGTNPKPFRGEIVGVLNDGIAPGLDMVMARLSSDEIDRVGGIWQGMSGSPVYTADGELIGAVAYGLSWGPSPVAGITPAEEMYRLLSAAPGDAAAAGTLRAAADAEKVRIPSRIQDRLVSSGTLTTSQAQEGLSRLPLPLGISGMSSSTRLAQAEKAFDLQGVRVHATGGAATEDTAIPVVAGGNLAASLSYGDVSAIGVGTATAVCGEEVLAFGHPMMFTGPSELTMHGADAVYVQEDSEWAPFKLANVGAPVGGIAQDRLGGLLGLQSAEAVPAAASVTSYVEVPGEWSREGTTKISVPDAVPDIASFHLLADQDRVFDAYGEGSALVGWTINGTRANGEPFRLVRTDRFSNTWDISYEPTWDFYDHMAQLQFSADEEVALTDIRTTSTMKRRHAALKISRVLVRRDGRWVTVRSDRPLSVRSGSVLRMRVVMSSAQIGQRTVGASLRVPGRVGRARGVLEVQGGSSYWSQSGGEFDEEEFFFGEEEQSESVDEILQRLRREPRNDHVLVRLTMQRRNGSEVRRGVRKLAPAIVEGAKLVPVSGRR